MMQFVCFTISKKENGGSKYVHKLDPFCLVDELDCFLELSNTSLIVKNRSSASSVDAIW